jgi:opacity protein-like surface antigen
MRHVWAFVFLCLAIPVFAQQDTPRTEVFGGYSYLHIDTRGETGASLDTLCNNISPGLCPAGTFQTHPNFNGWDAGVQINASPLFGFKADLSGNYGTPITLSPQAQTFLSQLGITGLPPNARSYSYLFGPVVFKNVRRFRPFGHALFGGNTISTDLSHVSVLGFRIPGLALTDTAFAMAFGGGLDVRLTDQISLRAGQADYLFTKHDFSGGVSGNATHQNNFRASVGVVFTFGGQPMQSPQQAPHRVTSTAAMQIPALGFYAAPREDNSGARITEVAPNSVAALAGLHPDDLINAVNGTQIRTPMELAGALSGIAPGSSVRLGYLIRGQWQSEKTVILGSH